MAEDANVCCNSLLSHSLSLLQYSVVDRVSRDSVWEGNTQGHGYQEMKAIRASLGDWVQLTRRPDWCIMVTDVPPQG